MAYQFYNPYYTNQANPYYPTQANFQQYNNQSAPTMQPAPSPMPNPQMFQQQTPSPPLYSGFQWVQGKAAASAYHLEPGQTAILMDSDAPVLYFKSCDQTGKPSPMIIYDLVERKEDDSEVKAANVDLSEYIKRSEIEELISKLINKQMGEMRLTPSPSIIPT